LLPHTNSYKQFPSLSSYRARPSCPRRGRGSTGKERKGEVRGENREKEEGWRK
jgi:hypothetical protein